MVGGILRHRANLSGAAGRGLLLAADRGRVEGDQLAAPVQGANGFCRFVHHDFFDLRLRRLLAHVRHHDFGPGGFQRCFRIEPRQKAGIDVEFFAEQLARAGVVEIFELRLFLERRWNALVERALHVAGLNFIFDQHRVVGCGGQARPRFRIEMAARLEPIGRLKRGERLLIVASGLTVDLAGGETGAVEQYFRLDGCRGAGTAGAALARRRRELRGIDGLRIECRCRGARPAAPRGVRCIRNHQYSGDAEQRRHYAGAQHGAIGNKHSHDSSSWR